MARKGILKDPTRVMRLVGVGIMIFGASGILSGAVEISRSSNEEVELREDLSEVRRNVTLTEDYITYKQKKMDALLDYYRSGIMYENEYIQELDYINSSSHVDDYIENTLQDEELKEQYYEISDKIEDVGNSVSRGFGLLAGGIVGVGVGAAWNATTPKSEKSKEDEMQA